MKLQCNRCYEEFEVDGAPPVGKLAGSAAARTYQLIRCPVCDTFDSHWAFAVDIAPMASFIGTSYQRKVQFQAWKNAH